MSELSKPHKFKIIPFLDFCKKIKRLHLWRVVDLCHKLEVLILPLKLLAVCVGRDVGRCRIGGASSGCCGLFHFATRSFFQPQKCLALLQQLLCFNCLMNVLASSKSAECGALPYNLRHHGSKWPIWGDPVGTWNCRLPVWQNGCSWCRTGVDKEQHPGWSLQKLLCERSAAEGIQYAAFPFWLHISETCAIALLFMPPSDLPKADYRKLPVNLKMHRTSLGTSSSALKINPGVWGDKDISLILQNCFTNRSLFPQTSNHHLSPLHRGLDPEDQV